MKSRKIALCGLLAALAVVLMMLAGAIGIGTYAGPVLAMAALLPILAEYGPKAALTAYAAVSLLGLLLVPELELALVFAAFGWYPVLRPWLNRRIGRRLPRILSKLALASGVMLLLYGVFLRLLGLTADLAGSSAPLLLLLLVLGNILFLLTDLVLERLTILWKKRFRRRFFQS